MPERLRDLLSIRSWEQAVRVLAFLRTLMSPLSWVWLVLLVVQGAFPALSVYLIKIIVDALAKAGNRIADTGSRIPDAGMEDLLFSWELLGPLLALGAVMILIQGLQSLSAWIRAAESERIQDRVLELIEERSIALDMAFYDSAEFFDKLHRARNQASYKPAALLENFGNSIQNGITLVAMGAILLPYGWWLPLVLILSTVPALYVVLRHSLAQHAWRRKNTEPERRSWYYYWLLTDRTTAAEIRLFELGDFFVEAFRDVRARLRKEKLILARNEGLGELAAGFLGLLAMAASMAWMLWKAVRGLASLGDLALFYQAFTQGQRLMRSLLVDMGQIYSNGLFMGDLVEFLDMRPEVLDPDAPRAFPTEVREGLVLENVRFRYPESERTALENFNLHIPAGKVVAIVGENGAGKSTLIKLICRLYDPESGRITLDGCPLSSFRLADLRQAITVLFQEPVRYNETVSENIHYGDLEIAEKTEIERAARDAGATSIIQKLPDGYESLLGKWFAGGVDLSVGEWQRIALARAFLRRSPIILLDEPTSAMDSWAEADWMARFRSLAKGRTVVIITHRFTTAMRADLIHVMADGKVIESGTHTELIARQGPYGGAWGAGRTT